MTKDQKIVLQLVLLYVFIMGGLCGSAVTAYLVMNGYVVYGQ